MKMSFVLLRRWVLSLLVVLVACQSAPAQEIDLVGRVGWQKFRRLIEIYAERIDNNLGVSSGSLQLQVWATATPYDGGDLVGYPVGTVRLRPLRGGGSYIDIDFLVRYRPPPAGLYYTTMTLEELTTDGYIISDYENFEEIVNFGGWGEGVAAGGGSNGDLYFDGTVAWASGDRRVNIAADFIVSERARRSGALRLRLLASTTPYDGSGTFTGYQLAKRPLRRLRPDHQYEDLSTFARFFAPPEGVYYVTLTLEENVRGRWFIVDFVTFPETSIF